MRTFQGVVGAGARAIIHLVAPARCAGCDAPTPDDELFCEVCEPNGAEAGRVECIESGHRVASTGVYGGGLARAVQRLKYRSRPDLARPLGRRLARVLRHLALEPTTLLVPVPLHPARLAERGYNQAALVARAAADVLGLVALPYALRRTRNTNEQATLARSSRLENVAFAFSAREVVRDLRIVIVDDVVTTGATALACATALGDAGAIVVGIGAIARADRADADPPREKASLSAKARPTSAKARASNSGPARFVEK